MDQVQWLAVLCLCAYLLQWFGVVAICMGCLYLLLSCRRNGSVIMSTTSSCKRRTRGGGPGSLKTKTLWVPLVHLSSSPAQRFYNYKSWGNSIRSVNLEGKCQWGQCDHSRGVSHKLISDPLHKGSKMSDQQIDTAFIMIKHMFIHLKPVLKLPC